MGVEKLITSKMMMPGSNRWIHSVHRHAGLSVAGLAADGRIIIARASSEVTNYKRVYGESIPVKEVAEHVASYVHLCTLYWWLKRYYGAATGKGRQATTTEIEKLKLSELACRQGVIEVAKIFYGVHDEAKDKAFQLEMSWCCDDSNRQNQKVPDDLLEEAKAAAKAALEVMDAD